MTLPKPIPDQVLTIDISVPIERVWHEITKTGAIQRAVNNTVLETPLTPGSKLRYYSPSKRRVFVVGEIVEIVPPRKFAHTWKFTMSPDDPTLVTWELAAIPGGCRVTLTHSRWTDPAKMYKSVEKGWGEILRLLKVELESGDIPLKTKLLYRVYGALEFLLPKSTTVDHVTRAGW